MSLEGFKQLLVAAINCCNSDASKQTTGLKDPEALARETVCMCLYNTFELKF